MKNYIVIFLLLSLISPYMSVFSYFALKKYEIESNYAEKVQAGTISSELVALEFSREQSKNDLNWISKREFNFESACYRVIKVQYVGELIVYFCWKNIENTNLHRNLVDLIAGVIGHDNANRQFASNFISFLTEVFSKSEMIKIQPIFALEKKIMSFELYSLLYRDSSCIYHPPKALNS